MTTRTSGRGQVLVMFTLFLLVLLGVSALAIDYASWLLTDRALQNYADHAALAGASQFEQRETQGDCAGGSSAKCITARTQAWASLNNELKLNLTDDIINCLGQAGPDGGDSPPAGETTSARASDGACTSDAEVDFGHTIWVTTPPPNYAAYTGVGGQYISNYGVVFVRVDREVTAFISGALGISPDPRHGWATAGAIPTDFALEIFCRDSAEPYQNCKNDGLSVAGGGNGESGIRLIRGDIGSNESLQTTSQNNRGVIVEAGNVFLVNGQCHNSTWNCPVSPAVTGGIADDDPTDTPNTANMKTAFHMPPISVPRFASPVAGTIEAADCAGASSSSLCVPYRDQTDSSPTAPGVWGCGPGYPEACGTPTIDNVNGTVVCAGVNGGLPPVHYYPTALTPENQILARNPTQSNGNEFNNINDRVEDGDLDTSATNPPTDWIYTQDVNVTGGSGPFSQTVTINIGPAGNRVSGNSTVRYVVFKTSEAAPDAPTPAANGNSVTLFQVRLLPASGSTAIASDTTPRTLDDIPTQYSFNVGAGLISAAGGYNGLRLEFTFRSSGSQDAIDERSGGIAWAEIEHPDPQPAVPPMVPPGYYSKLDVDVDGCAVLDPTAEFTPSRSLGNFQMPGIYRFGGTGNDDRIQLDPGAYLIGDGVTLVFDPPCDQVSGSTNCWENSGSNKGVDLGADSGLVLNTATTANAAGVTPCTPYEEFGPYNPSDPLVEFFGSSNALPYSALCAAWAYDPSVATGVRPGLASWPACDLASPDSGSHCIERTSYLPTAGYRGITFFFATAAWPPSDIANRFEMQGGSSGLAFRGVLYAPYDDVAISGKNGFDTVGQVLAWTAKFHGGGATIDLDYPYEYVDAKPYLLEPTVGT